MVTFFRADSTVFTDIMGIMGKSMIVATQLAAPALIMTLMTDFFLGIANRMALKFKLHF